MDWAGDEATMALFRHYALQNALEYNGAGQVGSVIGRIMAEREDLRQHGKTISAILAAEVDAANKMANDFGMDEIRSILESEAPHLLDKRVKERRTGLPELPNVGDSVILRFAPNPNGPLSFGHGRGVIINSEYAKQHDGILILRFDDTDTRKKPPLPSAYQQIISEVEWMTGVTPHRVVYASSRIEIYYEYAEKILTSGEAYVCNCSGEEFKQFREQQTQCPCRDQSSKENILKWKSMHEPNSIPGSAVVRIKTDMAAKNPALRDWPALRIQDTTENPHPRPEIASKYRVWPLLDFQSAIEDHLQGVTHIIRGKDLMDSTRKQKLLYDKFSWDYPETIYWGRVKIHEFGGFSTSGMRQDIESGLWSGWNDVRLPTISALQRRGISPGALRDFWVELGLTQKDIAVPLSTLFSINSKLIDSDTPRLSFVRNPIEVTLSANHFTQDEEIAVATHPTNSMGTRIFSLKWREGGTSVLLEKEDFDGAEELRLKEWCDIKLGANNLAEITSLEPSGDKPIVHWLGPLSTPAVLIKPVGVELQQITGMLEPNDYENGTVVQLERAGFARIERDQKSGITTLIYLHD